MKSVKEGDRIGVPWLHTACGHCTHGRTGWETLCYDQQNTGYSVNGAFADYVLADPNYVGLLPDALVSWVPMEAINDIFHRMEGETIDGRIVMRI